jgi:hypothetical protein
MSCSSSRKHALPSRTPHSLGILPSVKTDQNFLFFILKNYFEKRKRKKKGGQKIVVCNMLSKYTKKYF